MAGNRFIRNRLAALCAAFIFLYSAGCDKDVSVNPPEGPIPQGRIDISSKPSGARIYLDGEDIGRFTPDSIRYIKEGNHKITLKITDYRDSVFFVDVKDGQPLKMDIDFTKNEAMKSTILCKSAVAKSQIFLNGVFTGKYTPDTLRSLLPGTYNIKYKQKGYWDDSLNISIKSGGVYTADFAIRDTSKWVVFDKGHLLPTNNLSCVHVDKNNVKWIGTTDAGLIKFDGLKAVVYNTGNSGIGGDNINAITSDRNGKLWIATLNGVSTFDGYSWVNYNQMNSGIPSDNVIRIAPGASGEILIGTYNAGAAVFNGASWKAYQTSNSGLPDNFIKAVFIDSKGNKWIGTAREGLVKFDGSKWTSYKIPDWIVASVKIVNEFRTDTTYFSNNIASVFVQDNGVMYVSTDDQVVTGRPYIASALLYYPNSNDPQGPERATLSGVTLNKATGITIDAAGNKWITTPKGFYKVNGGPVLSGKKFDHVNSDFSDDFTTSVSIDREGNKWVTSTIGGLIKYKAD